MVKALGKFVIVEIRNNTERKTDGGLYLPAASDKENQSKATVVSIGSKVTDIKEGDTVIISRLNGELFEHEAKYYRALTEEDVFGVIS